MHSFDRILLSAFEFDVHAVIKESRYTISLLISANYTRKDKTRLTQDANFPYKRHISSKIRRDQAKTRLILEQPLTPVLR